MRFLKMMFRSGVVYFPLSTTYGAIRHVLGLKKNYTTGRDSLRNVNVLSQSFCRIGFEYFDPQFSKKNSQRFFNLRIGRRFYSNRNILSLSDRGLISGFFPSDAPQNITNICNGKPQVMYAGFDPTAKSLHVGNLIVLMMLLHCQRAGHSVIALIGGATGMIGDPSGKNAERSELDASFVEENCKTISQDIRKVFENHQKYFWDDKKGKEPLPPLVVLNNMDWYRNLSALEFIGKYGRHVRLGQMLGRQSIESRLKSEAGMSYTEFSYQIFQSYDWVHLFKKYGCSFQIGGHDQMGNMVSGHDLISRSLKKPVYGVTVPLVTTEAGNKYGKTAGNAIWLQDELTSAFELYQFLIRIPDSDVEKLLYYFTFLTTSEIEAIIRKHKLIPEKRHAQRELAKNVTLLIHGEIGLKSAVMTTEVLYSENVEALSTLNPEEVSRIFKSPSGSVGASEVYLQPGTTILDMSLEAGCFRNKNDAMRIIEAGGFSLNYQKVSNFEQVIVPGIHILPNKITLARVGKKNYYVIKWNP